MNPHLTTSAIPATRSGRGRVASASRSQSTPAGGWNEPTRFLPSGVLIPVFPPTAASTIASSVVGTWTTRTPRSHVAATKPGEVGDGAAPDADDRIGPGEPGLAERAPELGGDGGALGLLRVRNHGEVRVEAGLAGGVGDPLRPDRERRRVDDEDAFDGIAQQGHDRVDDPVTDDHLVRVVARPDGDAGQRAGHGAAPGPGRPTASAPATSAATSSGVRPAVSARSVATAS